MSNDRRRDAEHRAQPSLFDDEQMAAARPVHFDGPDYEPELDQTRLTGQLARIVEVMRGGRWMTLYEIAEEADAPPASVSAQLRHLRKPRFGSNTVDKRKRGHEKGGLFEYRLTLNRHPSQER